MIGRHLTILRIDGNSAEAMDWLHSQNVYPIMRLDHSFTMLSSVAGTCGWLKICLPFGIFLEELFEERKRLFLS